MKITSNCQNDETRLVTRRSFVATTAATGALAVLKPSSVFGTEASSVIEIGLIGCGGRGRWIADLFAKSGKYRFVACADYFQDRVDAAGEKFGIDAGRRYTGLSGYKRLLESKVEAVVIETPPYFHPEHAWAAVQSDKHVFLAKPIAVDVPGCLTIARAGKQATEKKRVFLVDFQTRANEHFRKAIDLVHAGAIGKLVMVEAFYPWSGGGRGQVPTQPEEQLRKWYYVLPISGDFIVEQSIHSLDVATWVINADPIRARGTGGRKVRPPGSIWDHFAVTYWFPDDLVLSFTCIQSIPFVKDEIRVRAFGADGFIDCDYYTGVSLRGNDQVLRESVGDLYTSGAVANINGFYDAIVAGNYANPTVAPSVRSNLTAILGREAAYHDSEITWHSLLKNHQRLEPNLKGLKA
jgi:predicted dehydrogenase